MIAVCSKPAGVEGGTDRADLAVHHRARRDDVGAGSRLGDGRLGQPDERGVVVDAPVGRRAARSGRGRCTRTGTCRRSSTSGSSRARIRRNASWTIPSSADASEPSGVLRLGQAEEDDAADAELGQARGLRGGEVRRQPGLARASSRSGRDGPTPGWTKSGATSIEGWRRVSRTSARSAGVRRNRRGRTGSDGWPAVAAVEGGASRSSVMGSPVAEGRGRVRSPRQARPSPGLGRRRGSGTQPHGLRRPSRDRCRPTGIETDIDRLGPRERDQASDGRAARERDGGDRPIRQRAAEQSARDSRAPRASGRRSTSSTSAPRARRAIASSSSARSPRTTRTRSPAHDRQLDGQRDPAALARLERDLDALVFEDPARRRSDRRPGRCSRARSGSARPP